MKYIDAEKLKAKVKELNLVTKTYEEQVAFNNALAMVVEIIDSLKQEQVEVLKEQAKRYCCDTWGIIPDALEEVEGFIDFLQQKPTLRL